MHLGEIRIFCGAFAPKGWAFCDGQLLDVRHHPELFALLGSNYGGDGVDTFAVPDLRGRVALHEGTNESTGSSYALGARGGVEEVALNGEQLPQHTHHVLACPGPGNSAAPSRALLAVPAGTSQTRLELYSAGEASGRLHPHAVRPSGGSQPHDNMMPFLTLNFILRVAAPAQS